MISFRTLRRKVLPFLCVLLLIFAVHGFAHGQQTIDFTSEGEYPPGSVRCGLTVDMQSGNVDVSEVRLGLGACYSTLFNEQGVAEAMDRVGKFTALEEFFWSGDIPLSVLLKHGTTSKRLRRLNVSLDQFRSRPSEYPTLPKLESLSLSCNKISLKDAEVLEAVRRSPNLRELHLTFAKVTQVQLAELLQSSSIERLTLDHCEIEHDTLAAISEGKSLTDLTVNYDGITDDTLNGLSGLTSLSVVFTKPVENVDELERLTSRGVDFRLLNPNDARSILTALPKTHIRDVSVIGKIDRALVDQIVRLPHLNRLSLEGEFDRDVLDRIGKAKHLEYLTIESMVFGELPRISIASLVPLTALKRLKLSHLEIVVDPASVTRLGLPSLTWISIVSVKNAEEMLGKLLADGHLPKTLAMYPEQFKKLEKDLEIDDRSYSNVELQLIADGDEFHELAVLQDVLSGKLNFKALQLVTDLIHLDEVRRIAAKRPRMP